MSAAKIRELNDRFRTTMTGGRVMMTAGVDALPSDVKAMVIRRVATFSDFNADNDPHQEHDFGSFTLSGRKFFWKIDCYDSALEFGSEDPTDPSKTTRVLTIMRIKAFLTSGDVLPSTTQAPIARQALVQDFPDAKAAKAIAYKQCGKSREAETWARKLVELLECANILRSEG